MSAPTAAGADGILLELLSPIGRDDLIVAEGELARADAAAAERVAAHFTDLVAAGRRRPTTSPRPSSPP